MSFWTYWSGVDSFGSDPSIQEGKHLKLLLRAHHRAGFVLESKIKPGTLEAALHDVMGIWDAQPVMVDVLIQFGKQVLG